LAETKSVTQSELKRQYRVLGQMITMHSILAQRFSRYALLLDISLLVASVVFCATTFVSDEFFLQVGLVPKTVKLVLGIVSILAFFAAIVSLRVDWKGAEAMNREAAQKLTATLSEFRGAQLSSGDWSRSDLARLNDRYWDVMNNIIKVPDRKFPSLKIRHLRKVELSKLIDTFYGTPLIVLRVIIMCRSIRSILKSAKHE
jgi:hypothetical protein